MPNREKLGSVWVDTGSLLIGDPCAVIPDPDDSPPINYDQFIQLWHDQGTDVPNRLRPSGEALDRLRAEGWDVDDLHGLFPPTVRQEAKHVAITNRNGVVAALAYRTGVDGWYPVFVERDAKGEPVRLVIELGGMVDP